ncbi:hypothetical protein CEP51_000934 [Fusarium floridanum]|uniref:Zn(2)-C6 fungal-type domain-containing protein n=1 Tax=Fusarium floridanum TaxID=1325733 RepID=A0A428SJU5_9HYPO|nr:hypothetical protein CEP51_000934 [Fusarium floridanum]
MSSLEAQDRGASNEDGSQDPSGVHDAPAVAPCDGENANEKRGDVVEVATSTNVGAESVERPERPVKKMKRGKYISRACTSCQQRKIKCEGGDPCRQCLIKQLPCLSSAPRGSGQQGRRDSRSTAGEIHVQPGIGPLPTSAESTISSEILARLDAVERHLRLMRPPGPDPTMPPLNHISPDEQLKHSPAKLQSALEADGQTFAGEITMNPAFEDDNDTLDHNSVVSSGLRLEHSSPASSLHPQATSPGELGVRKGRWWFDSILAQHGVTIDENQSRYYLQVYLEEIHPMYPFIHPPAIWETFNEMWQYSTPWPTAESPEGEHMRVSMALVCFCLALGRCSISSRIADPSGVSSSGWSLYCVGKSLLQDLLETSNTATKSLLMLQVLIVRVIYLFRLDANQKAARVLALTVSVAHTIGIHRQSTIDNMPAFYNQLYCRAWWVIYMIDRRIALESGKPFLIQDSNVDTALPIDLSDEWMTRFSTRNETMAELQHEITAEVARDILPSPIPYVVAMIRYSRVAGKAWEVLYGVKASNAPAFAMVEYVDTVLCKLLDTAPKNLRYDPDEPYESQFSTSLRWQIKQTVILSTCCTYLRLLIRRPLLPSSRPLSLTEEDDLESSIECAGLAAKILTAHQNIKDDLIKYSFALSHYVTSCAMIMIALVSREVGSKKRYGSLVLAATQSLNLYSHKVWVSGKMTRCVSRLSRLAQQTLAGNMNDGHGRSPTSVRRDSRAGKPLQQLTPQAEDQEPYRIPSRSGTSIIHSNDLDGSVDAARREQESDAFSFNGDASITSSRANFRKNEQPSASWMAGPSSDSRNSWVMSDFNFETFGERFGSNNMGFPTFPGNERLDTTRDVNSVDRDYGEAKLGVLGLNGAFNLDMDMDPALMDLYDTSTMDLDILGSNLL